MNNYFQECPPLMSDGTHFTDWMSSDIRNDTIKTSHNIVRDDHYRVFLQQNGEKIIDFLWNENNKSMKCENNPCIHIYPTRVTYPMMDEEYNNYNYYMLNLRNKHKCKKYNDYRINNSHNI